MIEDFLVWLIGPNLAVGLAVFSGVAVTVFGFYKLRQQLVKATEREAKAYIEMMMRKD